ncbi:hypothetical protein [Sphingomonas sp.]|nr:hypothetical protein [Sphingomonas sp.]MBV9529246.1 hypothetical protein [Sphingomonas sp.]
MSIGASGIAEAALAQQVAIARGGKAPRSRQTVAKPDSATLVPEAR